MRRRRSARTLWFLSANIILGTTASNSSLSERFNVLLIISDDLSAEVVSCYGDSENQKSQCRTPHIDRLAGQGVRFTRAYCQYPVCGPSRAALMSGMYPQAIGVTGNGSSDRFTRNLGQRPSMAQLFRRDGYYTARVSKIYHMRVPGDITAGVDGPDHAASWVERFNCQGPEWMSTGRHAHLTTERLNRDAQKHYGLGFGGAFYVVRGDTDGSEQPDVQAASKAIELMELHRSAPFFLAVGFVRPHVPLVAPDEFFQPYPSEQMKLATRHDDDWSDIPPRGISKNSRSIGLSGQPARQREVLSAYYASVSFMDSQVGRLMDALERLKLRDNTIVVFTSDHGYHLGEHDFWQKMSLHEESTRIPLIIAAPNTKPKACNSLAQQIDIYPTLAELSALATPEHCQGKSLVPALRGQADQEIHEAVYCYKNRSHLLRTERWAYIVYQSESGKDGEDAVELYDMLHDPRQFTNLANDAAYAKVRAQLKKTLDGKLDNISGEKTGDIGD